MLRRLTPRIRRNLVLLLIFVSAIATSAGILFIDRVYDPYVNYYGQVMRKSEFNAQRTRESFCYSLHSFSLGIYSVCFDSMEELQQFSADWNSR